MLGGYPAFDGDSEKEIADCILAGDFNFDAPDNSNLEEGEEPLPDVWAEISDEGKNFISSLLVMDRKARPSAQKALEHPWFAAKIEKISESQFTRQKDLVKNLKKNRNVNKIQTAGIAFITS